MTTAIRTTVDEFLAPPPHKNNPFSPSRIRQKVMSTHLDGREALPTIQDESPDEQASNGEDNDKDSSAATLLPDSPPLRIKNKDDMGSSSKLPSPDTITVDTVDKHMYTAADPPLDIFVRTSGVERLSDFMLWQCHQDTQIFFLNCLWPDFDLKHFIWVLLEWQWRMKQRDRDGRAVSTFSGNKTQRHID